MVPVAMVIADLTAILDTVPAATRPVRGPFAQSATGGQPLPGALAYLGGGTDRHDEAANGALAGLPLGEDFRVCFTDAGPVLTIGTDSYLAVEMDLA